MSKIIFSDREIKILQKNPNIKRVSKLSITLPYGKSNMAYLSTIKDAYIYSDQGSHYTSPRYQWNLNKMTSIQYINHLLTA